MPFPEKGGSSGKDTSKVLEETEQGKVLTADEFKDKAAAAQVASTFDDALSFLRSLAKTNDYFVGYTLSEVISERIRLIGDDTEEADVFTGGVGLLASGVEEQNTEAGASDEFGRELPAIYHAPGMLVGKRYTLIARLNLFLADVVNAVKEARTVEAKSDGPLSGDKGEDTSAAQG